jgi:hypothetical protein
LLTLPLSTAAAITTYITMHAAGGSGLSSTAGAAATGGTRFNRERDLEGVVDALKRVVEKLRSENDRLRRSASEGQRTADSDKRLKEQRQRIAELTEEVASLRTK